MLKLDLSGIWNYRTDEEDQGIVREFFKEKFTGGDFRLPGSTCENRIGKENHYAEEYSRQIMRCPVEKYEYIAPLWLQREVEIPEEFEGKELKIYLERVNIASMLWIDGAPVGRQIIELSAPHIYKLPVGISCGKHIVTLRIDNRDLVNMADMASGYSVDTQGIWNGVIGRIELQARDKVYLERLQVYPNTNGFRVRLTTVTDIHAPMQEREAYVIFSVKTPEGKTLPVHKEKFILWTSRQNDYFDYGISDIRWWDEFSPDLYEVRAELFVLISDSDKNDEALRQKAKSGMIDVYGEFVDGKRFEKKGECFQNFGMRILERHGRQILLNGRQISLRGTIDCAQFPLTGYPPMDKVTWKKRMEIIKSYGFNHVRFHAWCPPEAAFEAADEVGMYLGIEMPMWLNYDISKVELGSDPAHADYYRRELFTLLDEYGNHPSMLLFSNGNENMGDFTLMEQLTVAGKAYDPRHLYTTTSNFDHPVQECEDYFNAFQVRGQRIRLQTTQNQVASDNRLSYQEAIESVDLPVISFEVGQYCVYPDVDIIGDYTGNMLPVNFEMVRKLLKRKGVYDRRKDYVRASGDLAFRLYKEDVEAAMRTEDMGGFQLLSFSDYTGQSLATIGLLDVFLRDKDVEELSQWTEFCNDTVPLFQYDRILSNTSVLKGRLSLYNFGKEKIENPTYEVKVYRACHGKESLYRDIKTSETEITIPLGEISEASILTIQVSVRGNGKTCTNSWKTYVYPAEAGGGEEGKDADMSQKGFLAMNEQHGAGEREIKKITNKEELKKIIQEGGIGLVDLHSFGKKMESSYIPVFWSPVHFPSAKPCSAIIEKDHPVFADFPTGKYPDYQWKDLMDHAAAADISSVKEKIIPLMELVPNFTDNTANGLLFEARSGRAKLLFCGFELMEDALPVIQLSRSIRNYLQSDFFDPKNELKEEEILEMWG